ncbi:MAG: hypothetical protein KGO49_07610 [Gammaproteobacteria bacterium]|nr:hypothetical protein [Gammaproteobacteria bacterium]
MRAALIVIGVIFSIFFLMHRCSQSRTSSSTVQNTPIEQRQQVLDQIVLLQPIKQYATKDYEELVQVANGTAQSSEVAAAVKSTLWWKLRNIVEARADDEGQQRWAKAYLQQLYDARSQGNCFPISFPLYSRTTVDENRELLQPSTQRQSAQALTYILTHHDGIRTAGDSMQASEGWASVSDKLVRDYGDDANLINVGETAKDKRRQCDVVISAFEYMLALPDAQQGQVIRWMLHNHIAIAVF